jgi:CRP/FNR family transcriptional regulator, cyclic AMP receptor protein
LDLEERDVTIGTKPSRMVDQPEHLSSLGPEALAAWQQSFLARLPVRAAAELAETALEIEVEAGQIVRRDHPSAPSVPMLAVGGLLRVFVSSSQGREVSIRYLRSGNVVSLPSAITGSARQGVQAITESRLLIMQSATMRRLARTNTEVSWLICQEISETLIEIAGNLATSVFQSVIERVAATLLELAKERDDGTLFVAANQQQIADAVGSVREVVARALRQLRAAAMIERKGVEIELLDVPGLSRLAEFGRDETGG